MTNKRNGTLYTGVTNSLARRVYEHRNKLIDGFSKKYSLDMLVYYECFEDIRDAISREKQIKSGSRLRKLTLINSFNASWSDLYDTLL